MATANPEHTDISTYSWARFGRLCAENGVTMGYEGSGLSRTWDPDRAVEKAHGYDAYAKTLAEKGERAAVDEVIDKEYAPVYAERGKP